MDGWPRIFGVLVPVALVILSNIITVILVLVTLWRKPTMNNNKTESDKVKEQVIGNYDEKKNKY